MCCNIVLPYSLNLILLNYRQFEIEILNTKKKSINHNFDTTTDLNYSFHNQFNISQKSYSISPVKNLIKDHLSNNNKISKVISNLYDNNRLENNLMSVEQKKTCSGRILPTVTTINDFISYNKDYIDNVSQCFLLDVNIKQNTPEIISKTGYF